MKSKHTCINIFNAAAGRCKQKEGYTLIEVLMAISLLAVGMLAIASLQTSGIRVNANARHITTRTTWAQDRIEKLMALPNSDPLLAVAGNPTPVPTPDNYTISWVVAANPSVANTIRITVTVTGHGGKTVLRAIKAQ
jgi:type IV pilus assembly protein PilV